MNSMMKSWMEQYVVIASGLMFLNLGSALAQDMEDAFAPDKRGYLTHAVPLLKKHCFECHGPEKKKGGFRVDQDIPNQFQAAHVAEKWLEVLHVLDAGEMPPEDEPQPDRKAVTAMIEWIERELDRAEESRTGSSIVLRRLNRAEYDNTIRDLTGMDLNLSERFGFPEDPPASGFDNIGDALVMSPLQLELYLDAAEFLMDRLIVSGERPKSIKWRVQFENGTKGMDRYREDFDGQNLIVNAGKNPIENGMVVMHHDSWNKVPGFRSFEVPYEGKYRVTVRAAAKVPTADEVVLAAKRIYEGSNREAQWANVEPHFRDRQYQYGPPRMRLESRFKNSQPIVWGDVDVAAAVSSPKIYEFNTYFGADGAGLRIKNVYQIPKHLYNSWMQSAEVFMDPEKVKVSFPRPTLYLDWLELEGPILESWPPEPHRRLLFDASIRATDEVAYAKQVLTRFMTLAYRRPVTDGEVTKKLAIFERVRATKPNFEEAIKQPLAAVLVSPKFLFITEPEPATPAESISPERIFTAPDGRTIKATATARTLDEVRIARNGKELIAPIKAFSPKDQAFIKKLPTVASVPKGRVLDNYEIASRLSYFLWSSMPDTELFELAESGEIRMPETLIPKIRRMLKDEKARAFVTNFAGQWLGLREIGANPPGPEIFPRYDRHLEMSMRRETEEFFAEVLYKDLPVENFLKSDWTMLNGRLARFYGIDDVKGDAIRRVSLTPESHRGGIVTQGSMLTITSNGTRTSPVVRGKWILEALLGDPPPPPPPNVEEIPQANVDAALPIRDRLNQHREQESCARCHNKIDPLGFALENFDGSGRWRTHEIWDKYGRPGPRDAEIDPSAKLPDGTEFSGADGLRDALVGKSDAFKACLAEKMATYALGRELTRSDHDMTERAVKYMKRNRNTLRSLIEFIATSPQFFTK